MRPNNLRRWLLRGALIASAATASLAGAEAAHAGDVIWQNLPEAAVAESTAPADEVHLLENHDIIWQ
ncbi:hypothetical protein [Catelliglobosispora koreensis]|uniref:hypothetical protein n=1 Tax=Catelliglobosispora koreensis TaxID=129052 RepID=UPI00035F0210|nr:hypothetical protein [Catelliglobosispora koreensis]